jgi:hypothetical protein
MPQFVIATAPIWRVDLDSNSYCPNFQLQLQFEIWTSSVVSFVAHTRTYTPTRRTKPALWNVVRRGLSHCSLSMFIQGSCCCAFIQHAPNVSTSQFRKCEGEYVCGLLSFLRGVPVDVLAVLPSAVPVLQKVMAWRHSLLRSLIMAISVHTNSKS